ncbi:unnamed protein product [Didymodactylos carnosus]|uniref:Uncharacterized protein n=1 Tax=Didymodactylos carnosus TaxID=1234261 RepID=A0A8S2G582_9BILA|nr:unnamed protein product [Didymodactylos carnosus]CAF4459758.1 unnamed protein product [Didymodactylos carnosus]
MTIFKCYYHYRRHSHTLINYTEYPFHEPNSSAYQSLVKRCRQSFKTTGCCYLPNFISNKTLETILNEITEWLNKYGDRVFHSYELHNLHLQETTNTDEEQQKSSKTVIAYDQIPTTSLLHQIYQYNPLTEFVRQITTPETKLYRSRDEMGAMYVNIYEKGNQLNWH